MSELDDKIAELVRAARGGRPAAASLVNMMNDLNVAVAASEMAEDEHEPHVVVIVDTDPVTATAGVPNQVVYGPYPDVHSALAAAVRLEQEANRVSTDPHPFKALTARLYRENQ